MIASHRLVRPVTCEPAQRPGLLATVQLWLERHRQRQALLSLNDHMLKDIGVSRADAWQEAHKPFWRG